MTSELELSITALRKDEERRKPKETTFKGSVVYYSPDGTKKLESFLLTDL